MPALTDEDIEYIKDRLLNDVDGKPERKVALFLLDKCTVIKSCRIDKIHYKEILEGTGYSSKTHLNTALNGLERHHIIEKINHSKNGIEIVFELPIKRAKTKMKRTGGMPKTQQNGL